MSKFEKSAYKNILMNESIISSILKIMLKPAFKRALKKVNKHIDEDPDLKASLIDLQRQQEITQQKIKSFCKEFPHLCKKK